MHGQTIAPEPFPPPIEVRQYPSVLRTIWPWAKWNLCVALPLHVLSTAGAPGTKAPPLVSRHFPARPTTSTSGKDHVSPVVAATWQVEVESESPPCCPERQPPSFAVMNL